MEFTHDKSWGHIKRRIIVTDGQVIKHPSSSTGKKVRVTSVTVEFQLREDGWHLPQFGSGVAVAGVVLKADGTDSRTTGAWVVFEADRYFWIRKLTEALTPEGVPALPFRLSGLEDDHGDA